MVEVLCSTWEAWYKAVRIHVEVIWESCTEHRMLSIWLSGFTEGLDVDHTGSL